MLSLVFALLSVHAQEPAAQAPAAPEAAPEEEAAPSSRPYLMNVNVRTRYLHLPGAILDTFTDAHEGDAYPRPTPRGYSIGLEWVMESKGNQGIFYLDWAGAKLDDGYWDDLDDDPTDGSWLEANKLGMVMIGANYASEIPFNDWLALNVGGGLGLGIPTGEIQEWKPGWEEDLQDPDCGATQPSYVRAQTLGCTSDGPVQLWRTFPVVDLNLGLRFKINDQASIRVEGGLHDLLYGGVAGGIVF